MGKSALARGTLTHGGTQLRAVEIGPGRVLFRNDARAIRVAIVVGLVVAPVDVGIVHGAAGAGETAPEDGAVADPAPGALARLIRCADPGFTREQTRDEAVDGRVTDRGQIPAIAQVPAGLSRGGPAQQAPDGGKAVSVRTETLRGRAGRRSRCRIRRRRRVDWRRACIQRLEWGRRFGASSDRLGEPGLRPGLGRTSAS